jgi:hypothetical protein
LFERRVIVRVRDEGINRKSDKRSISDDALEGNELLKLMAEQLSHGLQPLRIAHDSRYCVMVMSHLEQN